MFCLILISLLLPIRLYSLSLQPCYTATNLHHCKHYASGSPLTLYSLPPTNLPISLSIPTHPLYFIKPPPRPGQTAFPPVQVSQERRAITQPVECWAVGDYGLACYGRNTEAKVAQGGVGGHQDFILGKVRNFPPVS